MVLELAFFVVGAGSPPVFRAMEIGTGKGLDTFGTSSFSNSLNPCFTQEVRITLASEQIRFCAPVSQPYIVIKDNISDPNVSYAQLNQVNGYGVVNIKSVTPGYSPGIGRPVYNSGGVDKFRQAVWMDELLKTDRVVSDGPTGDFWNETIPGIQIDASISTALGILKVRSIEWYVEHEGRLWSFMLSWDIEIKNFNEWIETSKNFSIQETGGVESTDTAIDLGTVIPESKVASDNPNTGAPVDMGTPSWWSGVCNDNNYFAATGVHSILLGAAWHGVPACGPLTYKPPYSRHLVRFFTGAWGNMNLNASKWSCAFFIRNGG